MEFGNIWSKSFQEYKNNFKTVLGIYWWLYILPILVIYGFILIFFFSFFSDFILNNELPSSFMGEGLSPADFINITGNAVSDLPIPPEFVAVFGGLIAIGFLFGLLQYILHLGLIYLAFYNKKSNISVGAALKGGLQYFWPFLGLIIVLILALFGLFLLLIIPAIIFGIYWFFSPYILVGENTNIIESMKRSKALVKGRWWSTFGYLLLFAILISLISLALSIPGTILQVASSLVDSMGVSISAFFVKLTFNVIAAVFITPFSIYFIKNFYLELKASSVNKKNN